jgi:NhaP-type Na+/H+ or K+/H+ antiporter
MRVKEMVKRKKTEPPMFKKNSWVDRCVLKKYDISENAVGGAISLIVFLAVALGLYLTQEGFSATNLFWVAVVYLGFCLFFSGCWAMCQKKEEAKKFLIAMVFFLFVLSLPWGIFILVNGFPIWLALILLIIVAEVLFILDKAKPREYLKFWKRIEFTGERKFISYSKAVLIVLSGSVVIEVMRRLFILIRANFMAIALWTIGAFTWIGEAVITLGILALIVGGIAIIIIGYVWLNSLKYKMKSNGKNRNA